MFDNAHTEPSFDITIQQERFAPTVPELHNLFSDLWSDIARDQMLPPMAVDYEKYSQLDAMGALRTFTVRWKGELVGVQVYFLGPNMHHKNSIWATCDVTWIRPDARRPMVSMRLIRFAEDTLRGEGATTIYIGAKIRRPEFGALLGFMGYTPVEVHFHKDLTNGT